jgi:flagellar protein FliL
MSDTPAAPAAAASAKKKSRALLFIVLGLVVVGGAGGGGFWYWKHSANAQGAPKPEKEATGVLSLEPFVVNLADREASRFLRATIKFVVEDEDVAEEIDKHPVKKSAVRSAVIEVLSAQVSAKLVTPEGKAELKKLLSERATAVLHTEIRDVLFTDFVVQF